mmetsp:Transcript_30301/g.67882  ORF Transcript_30301/g.67882 Transcript_30301/m.67882 type:complete len:219 (+) Transcript_30301:504-1160(+)
MKIVMATNAAAAKNASTPGHLRGYSLVCQVSIRRPSCAKNDCRTSAESQSCRMKPPAWTCQGMRSKMLHLMSQVLYRQLLSHRAKIMTTASQEICKLNPVSQVLQLLCHCAKKMNGWNQQMRMTPLLSQDRIHRPRAFLTNYPPLTNGRLELCSRIWALAKGGAKMAKRNMSLEIQYSRGVGRSKSLKSFLDIRVLNHPLKPMPGPSRLYHKNFAPIG